MVEEVAVQDLLARVSRIERRLDSGTTKEVAEGSRSARHLTRASFLKRVGALLAGAAGAAVLEARQAQNAYASTDTNFVATGFGGGNIGFSAASAANFAEGVDAWGSNAGVNGSSSSGFGVEGSSTSGIGVQGTSSSTDGVHGASHDGNGVFGISSTGYGVRGDSAFGVAGAFFGATVGGLFSGPQAPISLKPGATAGPPTTGTHSIGDVWVDVNGAHWICTAAGTPGTFMPLLQPGTNNTPLQTTLNANAGFASGSAVLSADAQSSVNGSANIDGVHGTGAGLYSGVAGVGGNANGTGVFGLGGGTAGPGVRGYAGGSTIASSPAGAGVFGQGGTSSNGPGVAGLGGGTGPGVSGTSTNGNGVSGSSSAGVGVTASSTYGWGLSATSSQNAAINGSSVAGVGGQFYGGRAAITLLPATTPGSPTSGAHSVGDVFVDSRGTQWVCTAAGSPGTFTAVQTGGLNQALFTAESTSQFTLANSDGTTWMDMDTTNLKLTITPAFNCQAILSGNADLWTSVAGFNQDIGITISGGIYPTTVGQPEAWKESGGFAGTFSPNAAFVQTVVPLLAATTYTIKLRWKANKSGISTIWAGAGPIGGKFSPTRLIAVLLVSA